MFLASLPCVICLNKLIGCTRRCVNGRASLISLKPFFKLFNSRLDKYEESIDDKRGKESSHSVVEVAKILLEAHATFHVLTDETKDASFLVKTSPRQNGNVIVSITYYNS